MKNEQELAAPKHALEIEGGRREGKVNAGMKSTGNDTVGDLGEKAIETKTQR